MLGSSTDKIFLALAVSVSLSGCGGRSLDVDTASWYIPDQEDGGWGGWDVVGGSSKGGTWRSSTARGGSSPSTSGGYTATGGYRIGSPPIGGTGPRYASTTTKGGTGPRYTSTTAKGGTGGYYTVRGGAGGVSGSSGKAGYANAAGKTPTAGTTNRGGASGAAGAASCTTYACADPCPAGRWLGTNGCYDCTCAPPAAQFSYDTTVSCPADSLTLSVVRSQDTSSSSPSWIFDFAWTCSALTSTADQSITGSVRVILAYTAIDSFGSPNHTFYLNLASAAAVVDFQQAQLSAEAGAVLALTPANGSFLSIRREGTRFVGGIYLLATPTTSDVKAVILAGPFNVEGLATLE